jgi:hypothetical protein
MRFTNAINVVFIVVALWICHSSLAAFDDPSQVQPPASESEKPKAKIRSSDKAVVKDVVYGLVEEGGKLFLTSQPLDGVERQVKRGALDFTLPEHDQVVELALAKLDGKNLMAVVKVRHGDEFDFHCLTFIGPGDDGHIRDRFAFHKARFFTTGKDFKILAIGGKHFGGSVFIVLGDTGLGDGDDWTTEGAFYFDGCPWPPNGGVLTPFRVTKKLQLGDKE